MSNSRVSEITLRQRFAALGNLPRFFRLVWRTAPRLALANAALRLLRAGLPVAMLYVGKLIIDAVVARTGGGDISTVYIWQLVALEFGLALLSDALGRATSLLDTLLGETFANVTSVQIMQHAAELDLEQFEDSRFYDKLERARQQTIGRTILLAQVLGQLQDVVTLAFLSAGLALFNPWLILLLLVAVVPGFLGELYFNGLNYSLSRRQTPERRELDYIRFVGASDETAKEVKLFNLSPFFIGRFIALSQKFFADNRRLALRRSGWGTLFALIASLGYYGAYVYIIWRTIGGALTIGDLTFLAGSFRQMRSGLEGILGRFTSVSQGAIYLQDFFDFFDIQPRIRREAGALPFPRPIREGFRFEGVGFRYSGAERWAVRNLSFSLAPAEKIALVGENGAGKTTVVKLLARLYEPTEGRILLDGRDLREYDLDGLRAAIGVIFQDFLKYQMTAAQNIAAGHIEGLEDRPRIEGAARQSMADEVVDRLPGRYDQALGRRFNQGVELSGGEWQKIALARAYMKEAQLVILDEPTSALDARAEYEVFRRFADLTKGKAAVLISHRFSTVRMADRILVLDGGGLLEEGSHEDLLRRGGRYAELFQLQARGYL